MKIIKEILPYVLIIIAVILIRTFIITPVRVDGASMDQTLEDGQILLLYKLANVDYGDIVVLDEEKEGEIIIKRIIGMPGDTVSIRDNTIYVNGEEVEEDYAYGETSDYEEITLDDDEYFILGDNRPISKDSRYFGPVKEDEIIGKIIFRLWPFNKFGTI
ncbi:MAG TPA: signal peptidase I [Candidatus Onthocola stercorigallinarum]|nr:signal peptidase I [Candidatus Onthocola stercorigallinarum]